MRLFFLVFLLFSQLLFGQDQEYPGLRLLTEEQVLSDHQILVQALSSIHPNQYLFLSEDEMLNAQGEIIRDIEKGLSNDEFHIRIRNFLRKLGCGHSVAKPSAEWYSYVKQNSHLLPFKVYLLDGELFIQEAYDRDSLLERGWKILAIDDKKTEDIYRDMLSIQEKDGITNSYSNFRIEGLFTTYYLFLYGQKESYTLTVEKDNGLVESLTIYAGKRKQISKKDEESYLFKSEMSNARFFIREEYPGTGILDIDRFNTKGYKKFYKDVFREIESRNIEHLILDLRDNGGGYFPNGNNLLKYLLNEKFYMTFNRPKLEGKKPPEARLAFWSKMTNLMFSMMPDQDKEDHRRNYSLSNKAKKKAHFDGRLYVLTNGGTFSLGSYVSTYLKHHSPAFFIGSETGGGEFGSNAVITYHLTLPESGIRVDIPYYYLDHQIERDENFGYGVQVHHEISYTIAEKLGGRDKAFEKALELIEKQK